MSLQKNQVLLLILLAYLFGVFCRFEWVYWANNFAQFIWDNELMITTNDGYAFAEGARDMLAGFHQANDLSYFGSPLSTLSAFVVEFSGFKLESVMIYLSIFLSSLIVIPLILIGRELENIKIGAVGAFVAVIANSYYNRTMAGYYDTDMLTIVLPCFSIWALIRTAKLKKSYFLAPLFMSLNMWWYSSSINLNLALLGFFVLYTLVFNRKDKESYLNIILMLFTLCFLALWIKFALLVAIWFLWSKKPEFFDFKKIVLLAVAVLALFGYLGGLNPFIFNIKFYLVRTAPDSTAFHFFNVNQTIMESGIVDFDVFCQRISSSVAVFVLGLVGYILGCIKFKPLLLSLPITLLGFLALKGGLRFTIYAVPFIAFGFGYFIFFISNLIKITPKTRKIFWYILGVLAFVPVIYLYYLQALSGKFATEFWLLLVLFAAIFVFYFYHFRKDFMAIFAFVACVFAITPSLIHIYTYKPLSVFAASEVNVLSQLKSIAKREDYALAWWDYGYAIRFYSDVKTLIDGGKHLGNDNFAVSKALISPQRTAANMARAEVEYTERKFSEKFPSNLAQMMKEYNATDPNEFLLSLENSSFVSPKASRDVYFVLPDRMHTILNVIAKFSMLDLKDGKSYTEPTFIFSENFKWQNGMIDFGDGLIMPEKGDKIIYGGKEHAVNMLVSTKYEDGKLKLSTSEHNPDAGLFVIYMQDYARFLIMDAQTFASSYIQLFVLENYDEELFEPVILDPAMKVYKLKN